MPFAGQKIMLAGLLVMELPTKTVRLCDGGFLYWGGAKFESVDADFGAIEGLEPVLEGAGDEAPGGKLVFLPSSTAAAATLSRPDFQNSRVRFYLAEVNEATGAVIGTPELLFDGLLDKTDLKLSRGTRRLEVDFISTAERLFLINEGNVLSSRFHKSVWPGELGLDNATGLQVSVAWGVAGPPRGSITSAAGGGGGSGFGASLLRALELADAQ
ncbi:hypothetical protein [Sphingosinicella sp. BN140058]|uniref:hypothetical protein n=1 Tax=Sphingosinicella sp. BN140058 TaxID=1892855 RepID=UPI0010138587|nr:hypothetical protein [Sphingosinicella sp. BN140058]QAY77928.1 hypothetical protein ETR14_16410 [Sphingosinicella sp. BN140058]